MRRNSNHNESGIFNARKGMYKGLLCLFTHKDMRTGKVFLDTEYRKEGDGRLTEINYKGDPWVPEDEVMWVEE